MRCFYLPTQHALFLFLVIQTLRHTVNRHRCKYYCQQLVEAMEKTGSSTLLREIYGQLSRMDNQSVCLVCQTTAILTVQIQRVLYAFQDT